MTKERYAMRNRDPTTQTLRVCGAFVKAVYVGVCVTEYV